MAFLEMGAAEMVDIVDTAEVVGIVDTAEVVDIVNAAEDSVAVEHCLEQKPMLLDSDYQL